MLYDPCLGIEKKILKEIFIFSDSYNHALAKRIPAPGVMKFTILIDTSLVIFLYIQ